ncbi:hypothetical protein FGADI_8911 [Fusarium gaditjirri]|uniref:Uncharacterized protein n=1 Tax=Fusarium gaditjirri TaxID=282569 RepID=A0A8H4WTM5_9HYPO|nr:hypothetical protein FGADI_8911 [Fusarium gaditjirri]
MRPPNIPLIAVLSVLLLLSCLLSSATGLGPQQYWGARKDVRDNDFIEARNPLGNTLADGYGPPPPYYTEEPLAPTDLAPHHSLKESTTTETQTGASEACVTSKSNVSSHYDAVSSGGSSLFVSSALETGTAMITVGSSAKAGSTSGSEALPSVHLTVSGSLLGTETSGVEASSISLGQVSTMSGTNSSLTGTHPSAGTTSSGAATEFSSGSASSATVSGFFNETKTITDSVSHTREVSSAEASDEFTTTELASGHESSVTKVGSITTTTKILSVTVTVSPSSSNGISSNFSSLTVPMTADETTTITVIPQQNSSELSTEDLATHTGSEGQATLGSLATESTKSATTQSMLTEISNSGSTHKSSLASNIPINGTVSFTTTTTAYFTTTVGVLVSSSVLSNSSGISTPTMVPSDDSSGVGTGDSSPIMVSSTVTFSTTVTTRKTYTTLNVASPATSSSFSSVPSSIISASVGVSGSNIATASNQTSSEALFTSTALPINATSNSATRSFALTTVSEGSAMTIFPGGFISTGSATSMVNNSVSTQYFTSASSRFNSSMPIRQTSFSSQTDSLLDWPTSTLTSSHASEATLEVPSLSFPTSWLSIITTPMTPPSVSTTPTRGLSDGSALGNITVIKTTMTSTITSSLAPTGLSSSGNVTVAHTTSGYNFSKSVGFSKSTFNSQSTSLGGFPGVSTVIISEQPTIFPFPSNTSLVWQSTASSMSLSESENTIGPKGGDATFSMTTAGFNSTTPYTSTTTTTASETYSSSNRDEAPSIITAGTSGSWNTTSTAQWFTNSTIQATTTATRTGSDFVSGTQTLSDTAAVTPQPPTSLNVTLTTISGSIYTKTFTDVTITIITPTFSTSGNVPFPTGLTSMGPFPLPSNTTLTGTGASLPPSGTGPRFTNTGTLGEFSTSSATIAPSIRTTYRTVNTTMTDTATDTSASASDTNSPLFPISNSTNLGTISLSTIVSWNPDPEPWTTWPTLSLTNEPGFSTWSVNSEISKSTSYTQTTTRSLTSTLAEPSMSRSSVHNLSSATSGSTSYARTTTLTLTTTLEESSTSPSTIGNRSSETSDSISYTRTTTVFRTTTLGGPGASPSALNNSSDDASLSTSYTRTTTLTLTTTLAEPPTSQVSGAAVTNSAVSAWTNVTSGATDFTRTETISLATVTSSLSGTLTTFLTTGSAKGVSTSLESSALAPVPLIDLHGCSVRRLDPYSDSSQYRLLDCSEWTSLIIVIRAGTNSHGRRLIGLQHNKQHDALVEHDSYIWCKRFVLFLIVTKVQSKDLGSARDDYPTPTDRVPEDPNFPWGNDSPIHRHQNSSELGPGEGDGDGGLSKRTNWRLKWESVRDKLEGLWHGQALKTKD